MLESIKRLFGIKSVDYKELAKNGAIIIDVRSKGEFSSGHIEKAINIPVDQLDKQLSKLKDKDQCIICYCASGMRSGMAKRMLQAKGYHNVYNGGSRQKLQSKL